MPHEEAATTASISLPSSSLKRYRPAAFSANPPTRGQYLSAFLVILALACLTLAIWPHANTALVPLPALMGFYQATVILADIATASLLFILFRELGEADILMLACGYLFNGYLAILHFLAFPGLVTATGVLGGPQTSPALWIVWHAAFPVMVSLAIVLRAFGGRFERPDRALGCALAAMAAVMALVLLAVTVGHDRLPVLVSSGSFSPMDEMFWPGLLALNLMAVATVGFGASRHSTLTLWLLVGTVAFALEIMLAWHANQRFGLGYYTSRLLSIIGSGALAGVFIIENALLLRNSSRLAAELQNALDDTQKATLSKSRFFAAASHDLRQPFQAMRLFYGVLDQTSASEQQRSVVVRLGQAMDNAETLLNEFLDIARLDNGAPAVQLRHFDLRELAGEVMSELLPVATHRGLRLRCRGPAIEVESDRAMMKRIVANLATNALRYTEQGGVLIATRRRGGRPTLEVWDTGIGIAESEKERIFEEFYQVSNPSRDRLRGTGLGLPIVMRLSALLGCKVDMISHLGRGSMFRVTIG